MARGKRESHWLVIRRCLSIIQRVQYGPTDWHGLVEAVLKDEPEAYGSATGQALNKCLHDDLNRIRQRLLIDLRADPRTKLYAIQDMARPLLDLPDDDLKAMAWLEQTFGPGTPHYEKVQGLLRNLRFYLSSQRRREIEQQRTDYVLELGQQDDDRIDPQVELKLREALARRLQVEFDYLSPQNEIGQPRRHVVDIFEPPRFEPMLGHYYLRGWCHYNVGTNDRFEPNHYIAYRLGRVSKIRFTGTRLSPTPPPATRYQVKYHLDANIARQGVTRRRWIDFDNVAPQPDESMIIEGTTDDIFFALQELMHYRHHCRVLGGPELLKKMRETIKKMADLYDQAE